MLYDSVDRVENIHKDFDSAPIFGLGLGYQFNNWLRADVTGEYRGKSNFHGYDIVYAGGNTYTDEYRGSKSEWLVLANVYADLGTWGAFTPFVGVGIGGSWNTISNFMDICTTCPGGGVAHGVSASKANFAWAAHAGVAYKVTNNVTIEFAYRYVDLGDALSGDLVTYLGQNNVNNPMHFRNITSHDFKFGVRWFLDSGSEVRADAIVSAAHAERLSRAIVMRGFRVLVTASVCGLAMIAPAHAADPPGAWLPEFKKPYYTELISGWYARADIGPAPIASAPSMRPRRTRSRHRSFRTPSWSAPAGTNTNGSAATSRSTSPSARSFTAIPRPTPDFTPSRSTP